MISLTKIFIFLLGFGLTTTGFMYIIAYLNLIDIGYNFLEYVQFITRRLECLNSIFGIILMISATSFKTKGEKYE